MPKIEKYEVSPKNMTSDIKIKKLKFNTTKDLKPMEEILGQQRATQAINFGINMKLKGYNIYVCGATGTGRTSYVRNVTTEYARENFDKNILKDYVYVYNFNDEYTPINISFPAGDGKIFQRNMEDIIKLIRKNIEKDFTTVKYSNESMKFSIDYENKVEEIIDRLNEKAMKKRVIFHIGDDGVVSMPLNKDFSVPTEQDIEKFTDEDFIKFKTASNKLHKELSKTMDELRRAEEEYNNLVESFDKNIASNVIDNALKKYTLLYKNNEKIIKYFCLFFHENFR